MKKVGAGGNMNKVTSYASICNCVFCTHPCRETRKFENEFERVFLIYYFSALRKIKVAFLKNKSFVYAKPGIFRENHEDESGQIQLFLSSKCRKYPGGAD
jgi:hypothetical protein